MRKSIAAVIATTAALGGLAVATPAQAATTRTLTSGVYVTPAGRDMELLPAYLPVARPGTYKTTGRPGSKPCALRTLDAYGVTGAHTILVKARSFTVRIPADTVVIEVSGVCKWRRA